jgi:Fur family peroxide stress response transcriptional regulator
MREITDTDEHPDVETVFRGVRERVPTISLDTVYRTLAVLVSHDLIDRVTATAGPARYDANIAPHHHFVCTRCGLVRDIESRELDTMRATEQTRKLGRVDTVQVHFRGICKACSRR